MDKLYSIGDTARIMGISVQTLRNYSNTSLLEPAYINEETGYRYFSFQQFHIIDRIKYLRGMGLSLSRIENIVKDGGIDTIVDALEERSREIEREIQELQDVKNDISWYVNYFKYHKQKNVFCLPRVEYFKERNILYTDIQENDTIEEIEVRLAKEKTLLQKNKGRYYRQFGYALDYSSIIKRVWNPSQYYIFVEKKPDADQDNIRTLPEGYYLCMKFRLYHLEELNINILHEYFMGMKPPKIVIANEYEDNLKMYSSCPYELQIFLEND